MKSLNQIIAELEDFATAHWQIHTFGHGDVWEISPQSSDIVYPVLWMVPQTATPTLNEVVDEFTVLCMDLVDSGERNETEVLSDTRQIILDVCAYYRQTHTNSYIIEFGGSIQPFTERDPERVSGHSLTIRIKQPHDYNLCAVPANAVPAPPIPSCADATVQNAASNPTYQASVASGGALVLPQLKVLDSDGVTPILANYIPNTSGYAATCSTPTCADASVTVNTAPFNTAPSGGALNVPVVSEGDNPVGSIVAGEVVIANNATFINGTQVTDQEAEVDANIFVTRDGAQSGAWNAGTQTWEVVSASDSVSVSVSDATPNFGDTITITATPSGIIPTSYLFFAFDGVSTSFIAEQVGAVVNWDVVMVGEVDVFVTATNGITSVTGSFSLSVVDANAQAFLSATSIVDPTIDSAIERLTTRLKIANIWAKSRVILPLVGGTATTHKYNLLNPVDSDAAFRCVFNGGWTHSADGAQPNGINGYADTMFNYFLQFASINDFSCGFYLNTNTSTGIDHGCDGASNSFFFTARSSIIGNTTRLSVGGTNPEIADPNSLGFYLANVTAMRKRKVIKNNNEVVINGDPSFGSFQNGTSTFGALRRSGTATFFTNRRYAFFYIGEGLTPSEQDELGDIVQEFQTSLGRQA